MIMGRPDDKVAPANECVNTHIGSENVGEHRTAGLG